MSKNDPASSYEQQLDRSPGSIWGHALTPILRVVIGVPLCVLWVLGVAYAASVFEEFDFELPGLSVIVLRTAHFWARMWPLGILMITAVVVMDFTICLVLKSHRLRFIWEITTWIMPALALLATLVAVVLPLLSLVQNLG
jgi:hypothetical protein